MPPRDEDQGAREVRPAARFGEAANLRARTARGTIVNATFLIGTNGLSLVQGLFLATVLSTSVYGLWGLLMAAFMTLLTLGSVGVDDKFIQQDDDDQQRAFEIAFTLQCLLALAFTFLLLVGIPLFSLLYGRPQIVGPGIALAFVMPALALQTPLWVHYRKMDFVRQRILQLIDPVMTFIVTIGLAVAGFGLWALVVGAMTGSYAAGLVMVRTSPYPLRLRWERGALREYRRFSVPLFFAAITGVALVQVPAIVGSRVLGIGAVAAIALATNISSFTTRVDDVVTQTLYPAICAVRDRTDLLFESFWKSNRLALLWAAPLGTAAALFAGDFVHYGIGEKWRFAAPLIAIFGLNAALNQIGFNWSAFIRALGDTRPIAIASVIGLISVLAIAVPLLATAGITAFGIGLGISTLIGVGVRMWYLRRIFPGLPVARHVVRGLGPTVPAAAAVVALRAFESGTRTPTRVAVEAVAFAVVAIAATYLSERPLLRESFGYLRGARFGSAFARTA